MYAQKENLYLEAPIVADNGVDVAYQLIARGHALSGIFFKHNHNKYDLRDHELKNALRSHNIFKNPFTQPMEKEVNLLLKIRDIVPSNSVAPIAQVIDSVGTCMGYVMEYVHGEMFFGKGRSYEQNRLDLTQLENIVAKLHENSVAHGNLKVGNIIIRPDNSIVLLDPASFCQILAINQQSDKMHLEEYRKCCRTG